MVPQQRFSLLGRRAAAFALAILANAPALSQTPPIQVPLVNSSFETPYSAVNDHNGQTTGFTANGWVDNDGYGDATAVYSADTTNPHSGASCQNISMSALRSGQLQLIQGLHLTGGSLYTIGAWLRGTPGSTVSVSLFGPAPSYPGYADIQTPVTGGWQYYTARGYVPDDADGGLLIGMSEPGSVCIDDVAVSYVPSGRPPMRPNLGPIAQSFFGMHVANYGESTFKNGGFSPPYRPAGAAGAAISGDVASAWSDNSEWADVGVTYAQDPTGGHGGGSAQKISVRSIVTGQVQMVQPVTVVTGQSYTYSVWLRGQPGVAMNMSIRNQNVPYNAYAYKTITLTSAWQRHTVTGQVNDNGQALLLVGLNSTGDAWVDDATFTTASGAAVANGVPWPQQPFGTLRLWDSDVTWSILEPSKGVWDFQTLDRWVASAKPGQDIMLTLGQSPTWASSRPGIVNYIGAGACAPPANIQDWTDYLTTVAQRYKGKIRYYEIWNEPNDHDFYCGSLSDLVALTKAAFTTLKAIDPANKIITAPPYRTGYLDAYLARGAAKYADIIGYHAYATPPEDAGRQLDAARMVMSKFGVFGMPLWDTEGASGDTTTPLAVAPSYLVRKFLVDLAFGATRFNWYAWGPVTDYFVGTEQNDHSKMTPAGIAYGHLHEWVTGASLTGASVDAAGNWQVALTLAGGARGLIVWNPKTPGSFRLPAGFQASSEKTIDGRQFPVSGPTLPVTGEPILLVGK